MIALFLSGVLSVSILYGVQSLQPGTGIVTGILRTVDGKPASGVRVGAVDVDDPTQSSLLSVTETDAAGKYRLINIPAGRYFIVAGKLNDLHYFPSGADRSNATEITIVAARIRADVNFTVPRESQRLSQAKVALSPDSAEARAYQRIAEEQVVDKKKQLVSQFEKNFPDSSRLPLAYISLSRSYASQQTQMDEALRNAEKAVALASVLKSRAPISSDWQRWVSSVDSSAQSNLGWVRQMMEWQNRALMSLTTPKRR